MLAIDPLENGMELILKAVNGPLVRVVVVGRFGIERVAARGLGHLKSELVCM